MMKSFFVELGFSGDTFQSFVVLTYQVEMTSMAANVMFGYWSHDIGGFHHYGAKGDDDPNDPEGVELLLRWVQFGAVSPIFRSHCDHCNRYFWLFPHFDQMRDAMQLRNAIVPYLYTQSRLAWDTGVMAIHPLYYGNSEISESYLYATKEYYFGDSILAVSVIMPGMR